MAEHELNHSGQNLLLLQISSEHMCACVFFSSSFKNGAKECWKDSLCNRPLNQSLLQSFKRFNFFFLFCIVVMNIAVSGYFAKLFGLLLSYFIG